MFYWEPFECDDLARLQIVGDLLGDGLADTLDLFQFVPFVHVLDCF